MSEKKSPRRGQVSVNIIEALSEGLYENILDVVREYVQNSYDAIGTRFSGDHAKGIIKVIQDRQRNSLLIHDNGCGMSRDGLETMANIGFSTKTEEQVGFRGIGSLAGFTVAKRLYFVSKDKDSDVPWVLSVDADSMIRLCKEPNVRKNPPLIEKAYDWYVTLKPASSRYESLFREFIGDDSSGTTVILDDIYNKCGTLLDSDAVRSYISRNLPVDFHPDYDYAPEIRQLLRKHVKDWCPTGIELNGKPVYKVYENDFGDDGLVRSEVLREEDGKPCAVIWYVMRYGRKQCQLTRGLVVVVKGFTVLDADRTITQILGFKTPGHGYWVSGEIHLIAEGIIPTTSRGNLKDNDARRRLLALMKPWAAGLNKAIRSRSEEQSASRADRKNVSDIDRKIGKFVKKAESGALVRADLSEMKKSLSETKARTADRLSQLDPRSKPVREDLEHTIDWIDKVEVALRDIRIPPVAEQIGLRGSSKEIVEIIENAIMHFRFDKYCDEADKLRADLMRNLVEKIKSRS